MRAMGTWFALAFMPAQRRHSRAWLRLALGREPRIGEVFRHFFAFEESLMLKLRVIDGLFHRCDYAPDATGFRDWLQGDYPALLGTFHVGVSDLLGFLLGDREKRLVHLVRLRVGNSHDTDALTARFGAHLKFVWINKPEEMLFALKEAAAAPGAIAMQCDRVEFASRAEPFEFFGGQRLFPFTIYHLSRVFQRPVVLSIGLQVDADHSVLHDSPVFRPVPGESREETRLRGRAHFQVFLQKLEGLLRQHPWAWFNFTPLNPPAASDRVDDGGGVGVGAPQP
jgi:predicted LPLAT superfamily acyltransferase